MFVFVSSVFVVFVLRIWRDQLWQWLEEACRKPVPGACESISMQNNYPRHQNIATITIKGIYI